MSMKNSNGNSGIKTATFQVVAQCLYHLWLRALPHLQLILTHVEKLLINNINKT